MSRKTHNAIAFCLIVLLASPNHASAGIFGFFKRCKKPTVCYTAPPTVCETPTPPCSPACPPVMSTAFAERVQVSQTCSVTAIVCNLMGETAEHTETGDCNDCVGLYQTAQQRLRAISSLSVADEGCSGVTGMCTDGFLCTPPLACPSLEYTGLRPVRYQAQVTGACCNGFLVKGATMTASTRSRAICLAYESFRLALALDCGSGCCDRLRSKSCTVKAICP